MKNTEMDCTFDVPPNKLGYFAMHCADNQALPPEAAAKMVNGPLTAMQGKLSVELSGKNDQAVQKSN